MRIGSRRGPLAACALALLAAAPLAAQGVGTTGAQVLNLPAGTRAAALAGAYTAALYDPDVVFYNPAGVASLSAAASLSYQRHVMDVSLGSVAGAFRVGPVTLAAGLAYLDAGNVPVVEPDPLFGGERGRETGATASATETAGRLAVGVPLLRNVLHLGAAAGFAASDLAGLSRSAVLFDVGAQAVLPYGITVGAALRNAGSAMSGGGAEDVDLPAEARVGASIRGTLAELQGGAPGAGTAAGLPGALGAMFTADFISHLEEETTRALLGLELGLFPTDTELPGAVVRLGYDTDPDLKGLNALHLGAGVSLRGIWLDYFYQGSDDFGAAHRIGVRWLRGRR